MWVCTVQYGIVVTVDGWGSLVTSQHNVCFFGSRQKWLNRQGRRVFVGANLMSRRGVPFVSHSFISTNCLSRIFACWNWEVEEGVVPVTCSVCWSEGVSSITQQVCVYCDPYRFQKHKTRSQFFVKDSPIAFQFNGTRTRRKKRRNGWNTSFIHSQHESYGNWRRIVTHVSPARCA